MPASIIEIEERLWQMAARLRANTPLHAHEYAEPALGLIFLKLAYKTFKKSDREIKKTFTPSERRPEPDMYRARNAIFLPEKATLSLAAQTDQSSGYRRRLAKRRWSSLRSGSKRN